jgi:hypothetical protein
VYVDETTGYSNGWDDQKVATDLGVPLAWVVAVRDENFGPNKSEHVSKIIEEARRLQQEVQEALQQANKVVVNVRDVLAPTITKLDLRLAKMEQNIKELEKRSK